MTQHVESIAFRTKQTHTQSRRQRREEGLRRTHPARVARLLAVAHDLDARLEAGEYQDYADIARQHGLTRARVTQVMNLLLLAPDIQAQVLELRFPPGREPVTERHLRKVLASAVWAEQREVWAGLRPTRHPDVLHTGGLRELQRPQGDLDAEHRSPSGASRRNPGGCPCTESVWCGGR